MLYIVEVLVSYEFNNLKNSLKSERSSILAIGHPSIQLDGIEALNGCRREPILFFLIRIGKRPNGDRTAIDSMHRSGKFLRFFFAHAVSTVSSL